MNTTSVCKGDFIVLCVYSGSRWAYHSFINHTSNCLMITLYILFPLRRLCILFNFTSIYIKLCNCICNIVVNHMLSFQFTLLLIVELWRKFMKTQYLSVIWSVTLIEFINRLLLPKNVLCYLSKVFLRSVPCLLLFLFICQILF